ncbi:GntR family transcriptional regulator [Saccharopolyspora sp. NFXS83]|uniref:GntR family transcriptional regulator n=1 Tax=Saccharopolyspora sp. NFXS83 TaxID=2993560 RepID=UPI00224ACEAF|nr:GntR family transcriptional regulator [Saccharopolyspora sp. NFXS83]MCX2730335.1 GntR family transcriptional regulator [Saccharopolyspora sp. NFXS83]
MGTSERIGTPAVAAAAGGKPSSVRRAIDQIRTMLRSQEILPGQSLRQEALAERLGVSRVPVREALKALEGEGVLHHRPNVGYTVARLSADELRQAYLMRAALETVVLREIPRLTTGQLAELTALNERIAEAAAAPDVALMLELNHEFHFAVFRHSGLNLVVDEIERVWQRTEVYRTVYLYDEASRRRIVREHRQLITALRRGSTERAVELMNAHRDATRDTLAPSLSPAPAPTT